MVHREAVNEGFVLDPQDSVPFGPRPARRLELCERLVKQARARAAEHDVELVIEPARRVSELAMLWFQGGRSRVLRAVGGWDPGAGIVLQIAHAGHCGTRYELVLVAAVERASSRHAA